MESDVVTNLGLQASVAKQLDLAEAAIVVIPFSGSLVDRAGTVSSSKRCFATTREARRFLGVTTDAEFDRMAADRFATAADPKSPAAVVAEVWQIKLRQKVAASPDEVSKRTPTSGPRGALTVLFFSFLFRGGGWGMGGDPSEENLDC